MTKKRHASRTWINNTKKGGEEKNRRRDVFVVADVPRNGERGIGKRAGYLVQNPAGRQQGLVEGKKR